MGGSRNAMSGNHEQPPVQTVAVDGFFIDKYEVTNAQFQKFVLANPDWQNGRIDRAFHNGHYLAHWKGNDCPKLRVQGLIPALISLRLAKDKNRGVMASQLFAKRYHTSITIRGLESIRRPLGPYYQTYRSTVW